MLPDLGRERGERLPEDMRGVHLIGGQILAVDLAVIDDGRDEALQTLALPENGRERLFLPLFIQRTRGEQLCKPVDGGERRIHLVRDVGDELILAALCLDDLFALFVDLAHALFGVLVHLVDDRGELLQFGHGRLDLFAVGRLLAQFLERPQNVARREIGDKQADRGIGDEKPRNGRERGEDDAPQRLGALGNADEIAVKLPAIVQEILPHRGRRAHVEALAALDGIRDLGPERAGAVLLVLRISDERAVRRQKGDARAIQGIGQFPRVRRVQLLHGARLVKDGHIAAQIKARVLHAVVVVDLRRKNGKDDERHRRDRKTRP